MTVLEQVEVVYNYLTSAYEPDDVKRLTKVKMVKFLATTQPLNPEFRSLIDKVAIFNGIKKGGES